MIYRFFYFSIPSVFALNFEVKKFNEPIELLEIDSKIFLDFTSEKIVIEKGICYFSNLKINQKIRLFNHSFNLEEISATIFKFQQLIVNGDIILSSQITNMIERKLALGTRLDILNDELLQAIAICSLQCYRSKSSKQSSGSFSTQMRLG